MNRNLEPDSEPDAEEYRAQSEKAIRIHLPYHRAGYQHVMCEKGP
jgi:hypothetical protein